MTSFNQEPVEKYRYLLSIDIGIKHLGMILLQCNQDYSINDIVWFELVDITEFHHLDVASEKTCELFHCKTMADWLSHIFYLHSELFDLSEYILIERQPPQGHVSVEQIIFFQYRKKAVLLHPRSIHKFFGWNSSICADIDYDKRKERSEEIFRYRLSKTERTWLKEAWEMLPRKHDISDAYLQAVYFCHNKNLMEVQALNAKSRLERTLEWSESLRGMEANLPNLLDKFQFCFTD